MKPLVRVPAMDVAGLTFALRRALSGGPAVWPAPGPDDGSVLAAVGEVDDGVALVVDRDGGADVAT
ncbi:hypothetical protein, partial [Agromyces humi]|uniref:hypothetical protein n=1 Tax=Agromyces humi TaxID=1766800 RepID=UPI0019397C27